MGCFNEISFSCPECGEIMYAQTKSGSSSMRTFSNSCTPLEEVNGLDDYIYCHECNTSFEIITPKTVSLELIER